MRPRRRVACRSKSKKESRRLILVWNDRSAIRRVDPFADVGWRAVLHHEAEQFFRTLSNGEELAVLRPNESLLHRMIEPSKKRVEKAGRVKQADWLAVQAELGPGEDLEKLIAGAVAAGQSRKA